MATKVPGLVNGAENAELPPANPSRLRLAVAGSVATGLAVQTALMVSGPLLARMLGLDGRGYLASLVLWPVLIAQLGSLGLPLAVTYHIAQEPAVAARVARAALRFGVPQTLLLTALHAMVLLVVLHGEPTSIRVAGAVTLAAVPASLAQQYGLAMLQGQQRFSAFNVLRLLPVVLYAGGVAALFVSGVTSIVAVAMVLMGANASVGAITLATGLRAVGSIGAARGSADLGAMLRFGLRGLLGTVSLIDSLRLDQVVLALFLAPAALGLYVVALAFTNLPRFVAQSVGMVVYPSVASRADETSARRSVWAFFWATGAMSVAIVAPLLLAAGRLVPLFFGDEFRDAVRVTQILLPGMLFSGMGRVLSDALKGRGHPAAGTLAEVTTWLWLAPALGVAVPLWGVNGVAVSMSSSYAVSLGVLLALAAAHGEARLPAALVFSPRAAWHRLRLFATPRLP
jgi:O-antigen/teichoic acid export membrane protein